MTTDHGNASQESCRPEADQCLAVPNCKETKEAHKGFEFILRKSLLVAFTTRGQSMLMQYFVEHEKSLKNKH